MTQTITFPYTVAALENAGAVSEIREAMWDLVRQHEVAGTVANAFLARLGIAPLYERFVVGARLPVTVTLCAHTPARATRDAAGLIVAALGSLHTGYLRTHTPASRAARRPVTDSVTGCRIIGQVRNPRLPSQPIFTVAATALLGATVGGTDRDAAWAQAHWQLSTELRALRPVNLLLHVEQLRKSWARNLGPETSPVTRPAR